MMNPLQAGYLNECVDGIVNVIQRMKHRDDETDACFL
jgi:hypothetical protein